MTTPHTDRSWLLRTAVAGVLLLAAGAFVLSYSALHAVAVAAGINPSLAGLYPLIIDGFITIASLAVLSLRDRSPRVTWYPWALLGGFFTVSVWCNALHAAARNGDVVLSEPTAALVSAMPPVALGLAIHLLILMIRPTTPGPPTATGHPSVSSVPALPFTGKEPAPHAGRRRTDRPADSSPMHSIAPARQARRRGHEQPAVSAASDEMRHRAARAIGEAQNSGTDITGAELGRRLGVSTRHGRRLLHSLNGHQQPTNPDIYTGASPPSPQTPPLG